MRKAIEFMSLTFLLCFVFGLNAEGRVTINDVNLTYEGRHNIFQFSDGPVKCAGMFYPKASLDCNLIGQIPNDFQEKYSEPSTIIYESNLSIKETDWTYSNYQKTITVEIFNEQICYHINTNINNDETVDISCIAIE